MKRNGKSEISEQLQLPADVRAALDALDQLDVNSSVQLGVIRIKVTWGLLPREAPAGDYRTLKILGHLRGHQMLQLVWSHPIPREGSSRFKRQVEAYLRRRRWVERERSPLEMTDDRNFLPSFRSI